MLVAKKNGCCSTCSRPNGSRISTDTVWAPVTPVMLVMSTGPGCTRRCSMTLPSTRTCTVDGKVTSVLNAAVGYWMKYGSIE
jgi:hypothetical protein